MGILDKYKYVTSYQVNTISKRYKRNEISSNNSIELEVVNPVILAKYNTDVNRHITAHRIEDYRRTQFKMQLLPNVNVLYTQLLIGAGIEDF